MSLRTRLVIGMAAMLLPLVLMVAAGRLYLLPRLTHSLEEVVEEVLEEMLPVVHLQNALLTLKTSFDHSRDTGNGLPIEWKIS